MKVSQKTRKKRKIQASLQSLKQQVLTMKLQITVMMVRQVIYWERKVVKCGRLSDESLSSPVKHTERLQKKIIISSQRRRSK
ncbi:unnamed protein product [Trichobilharzia regenti]|nr:unnamed protein product [Trichobilharzia regenti]